MMRSLILTGLAVLAVGLWLLNEKREEKVKASFTHASMHIGNTCETLVPFFAYGYTKNNNIKTTIENTYAVDMNPFRITGPEITFERNISAGAKIQLVGIQTECVALECYFGEPPKFRVTLLNPALHDLNKYNIWVNYRSLTDTNVHCEKIIKKEAS